MLDGWVVGEGLILALILLVGLPAAGLVLRRRYLAAGGWVFNCASRQHSSTPGTPWVPGVARLNGASLEFYPMFALVPRARFAVRRSPASIVETHALGAGERGLLEPRSARVVVLNTATGVVELALSASSLMALLSWAEAGPPGADLDRL